MLGQVFISKLGCFVIVQVMRCFRKRARLELKTLSDFVMKFKSFAIVDKRNLTMFVKS
jgi:hypothetical protein